MLLVDDDPFFLKLGQSLLRSDAYEVLTAANGAEGLRVARTALPDAVLLDVALPDLDGFEVCRRLKEDPLTAAIPVILLTGKSMPELNKKGFEVGAVAIVRKEVATPLFLNTLRVVLTTPPTRRTAPRVSVALPVTYECADRVGTGETLILSHRGMFISTPDPPEVGAHLLLHFALPGSELWESKARVVWTRRPEEEHPYPVGMGVKFLELPPGPEGMPGAGLTSRRTGKAGSDRLALKPYWGKLTGRNFRGGDGNACLCRHGRQVGIIRSPIRAIALPDRERST